MRIANNGIRVLLPPVFVAALLLAGCGGVDHGDRMPLSGRVTKGGQPLEDRATIYFDPVSGQDGVGSSGEISESRFEIPAESGPTPGLTYKVSVITSPGIPAEGTPRDQIRVAHAMKRPLRFPHERRAIPSW